MMKLLIADDHALVRDALKSHIERECSEATVLTAASVDDAVHLIDAFSDPPFSLVILDLRMPGMYGLQGLQRVKGCTPAPVAVMSGLADPTDAKAAVDAGAAGFLPKTLDGSALLGVVRSLIAGETHHLLTVRSLAGSEPKRPLTRKEEEVVSHLLLGMSNKEIARSLSVEEVTIKLHVKNICRKLDARNRTHAALEAMKIGYKAASTNDDRAGESHGGNPVGCGS
jgi:two-component system, NarL family, nitrate/nitrite response regulator NarL